MEKNREGYLVSETHRECTNCGKIFKRTSKTVTLCNECNSERVKCMSPERRMFARAKSRAKERGLEFNLSFEDIKIPEVCPILNIPLVVHKGSSGGTNNSPSLDRIDSGKGYVKDNIQVISQLANQMKTNASEENLVKFALWVLAGRGVTNHD